MDNCESGAEMFRVVDSGDVDQLVNFVDTHKPDMDRLVGSTPFVCSWDRLSPIGGVCKRYIPNLWDH